MHTGQSAIPSPALSSKSGAVVPRLDTKKHFVIPEGDGIHFYRRPTIPPCRSPTYPLIAPSSANIFELRALTPSRLGASSSGSHISNSRSMSLPSAPVPASWKGATSPLPFPWKPKLTRRGLNSQEEHLRLQRATHARSTQSADLPKCC